MIKTGSDFSGVGAFDQALKRLNIQYETIFACDWDKYARQTYIENYGEPKYFPKDVYEREIPNESLDIYMTSPPCQAFSLAGKRKGEDDERGILFYNSHEFIQKNKPRYFIFENVKGLLSDANGNTFKVWLDMLGGKSVNGNAVLFPNENSAPYHIYWQVLNAKKYGVPQNRERVFIIGIRDDLDNTFTFPKEQHLTKKLKDVLEHDVDEKYFLSENMVNRCTTYKWAKPFTDPDKKEISNCVTASYSKQASDCEYINVNSETKKSYGIATDQDFFILGYTRDEKGKVIKRNKLNHANTIHSSTGGGGNTDQFVCIGAMRGRGDNNQQQLEERKDGLSNSLTTVQKDNLVITKRIRRLTPRECFRLMDFPDTFKWSVSNSQAYKQAGNSIVVNVLAEIINKLKL
jgi:DNA (cytosine-5)-methyltransferase 1